MVDVITREYWSLHRVREVDFPTRSLTPGTPPSSPPREGSSTSPDRNLETEELLSRAL